MAVNYNPTDPVAGASRATKEVELWTDLGDTLPDINSRITATEAHLADASDAHDASAVSVLDAGAYFAGTDVEAVLQELGAGGGGGGAIRVEDEGVSTVAAATALNFAGAGVTVTDAGANEALVTIGGASTPAFSGVKLTKSATQSLTHETFTPITFNGETYDTASYHDNVTNNSRITIPTTGYYAFTGNVEWGAPTSAGNIIAGLRVNGVDLAVTWTRASIASAALVVQLVAADLLLTAGDYVELIGRQNTGSAFNVGAGSSFSCRFIGA